MATRIVCAVHVAEARHPSRERLAWVGVGDPEKPQFLDVQIVLSRMRSGELFFAVAVQTEERFEVESYFCPYCHEDHLRIDKGSIIESNLDSLPECPA